MVRLDGDLAPDKFAVDAADSLHEWAARRSFDLFNISSNPRTQTHWTPIAAGWLRNFNYRMSFYSPLAYDEWTKAKQYQEMTGNQPALAAQEREKQQRAAEGQQALERAAAAQAQAARDAEVAAQAAASQTQTPSPQPSK